MADCQTIFTENRFYVQEKKQGLLLHSYFIVLTAIPATAIKKNRGLEPAPNKTKTV